jgi:hypothetical protein
MFGRIILGGIIGAIILFAWGMFSWMYLPWHMRTVNNFKDETAISQAITANAPNSGIYVLPSMATAQKGTAAGMPMVFASVELKGMASSMTPQMIKAFVMQFIIAALITWILLRSMGGYGPKLGVAILLGILAAIAGNGPYSNWFGFDGAYTGVMMADTVISWFLAGLVLAWIAVRRN